MIQQKILGLLLQLLMQLGDVIAQQGRDQQARQQEMAALIKELAPKPAGQQVATINRDSRGRMESITIKRK